jgi:hypothetical protein
MIPSRSLRSGALLGLLSLASVALPRAEAQFAARQRTPNDTLKSTEVAADHKVTFRIFAPKASEVSVGGDFGEGGKLTKSAAAATPGSTGGTTSASSPHGCSSEANPVKPGPISPTMGPGDPKVRVGAATMAS